MSRSLRRGRDSAALKKDLRWGAAWGFFGGCFYSAVALLIYAFRGARPFEVNNVTLTSTIAVYLIGGLFAGVVVGFLRPLTRRHMGSVFVGITAAVPVALGAGYIAFGPVSGWGAGEAFGIAFTAVFLGGYMGWDYWEPDRSDDLPHR